MIFKKKDRDDIKSIKRNCALILSEISALKPVIGEKKGDLPYNQNIETKLRALIHQWIFLPDDSGIKNTKDRICYVKSVKIDKLMNYGTRDEYDVILNIVFLSLLKPEDVSAKLDVLRSHDHTYHLPTTDLEEHIDMLTKNVITNGEDSILSMIMSKKD